MANMIRQIYVYRTMILADENLLWFRTIKPLIIYWMSSKSTLTDEQLGQKAIKISVTLGDSAEMAFVTTEARSGELQWSSSFAVRNVSTCCEGLRVQDSEPLHTLQRAEQQQYTRGQAPPRRHLSAASALGWSLGELLKGCCGSSRELLAISGL